MIANLRISNSLQDTIFKLLSALAGLHVLGEIFVLLNRLEFLLYFLDFSDKSSLLGTEFTLELV